MIESGLMVPTPLTVAAVPATTWNQSDKSASITLTGSDLIATLNTSANGAVRSVASVVANQKVYFEAVVTAFVHRFSIGFSTSASSLTIALPGTATPSTAFLGPLFSSFRCDDSVNAGAALFAAAAADNVGCGFDSQNGKAWYRLNGGAWVGSAGGADPATNTNGLAVPFAGPYFAFYHADDTGDAITAKFASSDWTYAAPSGFSQLAA